MDLLRFLTCGSVDDGKSTLIGRLLYDSKSIFEDQLEAVTNSSRLMGEERVNLALLTDGLRAEREQGITIDVAYRYFATPNRKFIIADCPGHIQYTRNMVTGASTANLAIILIDARKGVLEQTKRHSFITSLLGLKHIIVCINKMDLVDYEESTYNKIKDEYISFASKLGVPDVRFIPISALNGDNVVESSKNMDWYRGSSLLYTLENVNVGHDHNFVDSRFPVQRVIRPQTDEHHDYRAFAGRVGSGVFKPGDRVRLLPSGFETNIKQIDTFNGPIAEAFPPMSVSIILEEDYDLSRGDMIVKPTNTPEIGQDIELMVCWLNTKPLKASGKYLVRHTTKEVKGIVKDVRYKVNINSLHRVEDDREINMNDIGRILIRVSKPLFYDEYKTNKSTGSVIIIDEFSNETVGAGMIL